MTVQDIKPDNILLNFDTNGTVVEAKLADCGKHRTTCSSDCERAKLMPYLIGDVCNVDLNKDPRGTAHMIGAAIFRSPEALLGLKWSTPTDIWSFGATVSLTIVPTMMSNCLILR